MKFKLIPSLLVILFLTALVCAFAQPATLKLELTWTDNSPDEAQFIIQRSLSANDADFGDIGSAPANATSYVDTMAPAGVKLWYRVRAVNALEQGDASAPAVWTPPAAPTTAPTPKPSTIPKKATNAKVRAIP